MRSKKIEELWGIDLRSLALFRIGLALLILCDLFFRSLDLRAHYTDTGVLPRVAVLEEVGSVWQISFHLASGVRLAQAALFLLAAGCAFLLLIGYRTRLATFASWLLMLSLHTRNPLVCFGADNLLRMLLFWTLFLPLGSRFSLDRTLERTPQEADQVFSTATIALLIQPLLVYEVTAIGKWLSPLWRDGSALSFIFQYDIRATSFAQSLLYHPVLLKFLTYAVVWLEGFAPLLLFIPFFTRFFRMLGIAALICFQLGIALCLRVGYFPWVASLAIIPFLSSAFWSWRSGEKNKKEKSVDASMLKASWVSNLAAGCFLAYVVVWNLGNLNLLKVPQPLLWVADAFRLDQRWYLFGRPPTEDGWFVIRGTLHNGAVRDPFRGGRPVVWEKPAETAFLYKSTRWTEYLEKIRKEKKDTLFHYFALYLCQDWNRTRGGEERLKEVEIFFVKEEILPTGQVKEPEKQFFWKESCPES